ncbi:hypothetical protein T265_05842, partial [Opisthorchis viverrini]
WRPLKVRSACQTVKRNYLDYLLLLYHAVSDPGREISSMYLLTVSEQPGSTSIPRALSRSAVALLRCLTAMPPEGCTKAGIPPGCPSLDRGSREAEVGFEPRTSSFASLEQLRVMRI